MSKTQISITEVTVLAGRTKSFNLEVDGEKVRIPVDGVVFGHYQDQFYRQNPTPQQKKKFATLCSLMRAAYMQGVKDGRAAR
ncbi:MAG: hypothetical protein ABSG21_07560 [Spirochaetia bacterium]|jgi:hypothetical protein